MNLSLQAVVAAALVLNLLTPPAQGLDTNRPETQLRQDVLIQNERFRVTWNRNSPTQNLPLFASNFEARFPGAPPIRDKETLRQAYVQLFSTQLHLEFTRVVTTRIARRRYRTRNFFRVTDRGATPPTSRTGTITFTWEFRGAIPRIVLDVTRFD